MRRCAARSGLGGRLALAARCAPRTLGRRPPRTLERRACRGCTYPRPRLGAAPGRDARASRVHGVPVSAVERSLLPRDVTLGRRLCTRCPYPRSNAPGCPAARRSSVERALGARIRGRTVGSGASLAGRAWGARQSRAFVGIGGADCGRSSMRAWGARASTGRAWGARPSIGRAAGRRADPCWLVGRAGAPPEGAATTGRAAGQAATTRSRPARLARYIARSAVSIRSSIG